jgi:hypothetical protein
MAAAGLMDGHARTASNRAQRWMRPPNTWSIELVGSYSLVGDTRTINGIHACPGWAIQWIPPKWQNDNVLLLSSSVVAQDKFEEAMIM